MSILHDLSKPRLCDLLAAEPRARAKQVWLYRSKYVVCSSFPANVIWFSLSLLSEFVVQYLNMKVQPELGKF
jgi:hypothetical protein